MKNIRKIKRKGNIFSFFCKTDRILLSNLRTRAFAICCVLVNQAILSHIEKRFDFVLKSARENVKAAVRQIFTEAALFMCTMQKVRIFHTHCEKISCRGVYFRSAWNPSDRPKNNSILL